MTDKPDFAAARKWAREELKREFDAGSFSAEWGVGSRAGEMRFWAEDADFEDGPDGVKVLTRRFWNESKVSELIGDARHQPAAHQAVCEIIAEHIEQETPLPDFLRDFLLGLLNGKNAQPARRRGWDPDARYGRDQAICLVVNQLNSLGGLNRTRDPKRTKNPSACSIVAEVLAELGVQRVSERAVEEITKPGRRSADDEPF